MGGGDGSTILALCLDLGCKARKVDLGDVVW